MYIILICVEVPSSVFHLQLIQKQSFELKIHFITPTCIYIFMTRIYIFTLWHYFGYRVFYNILLRRQGDYRLPIHNGYQLTYVDIVS